MYFKGVKDSHFEKLCAPLTREDPESPSTARKTEPSQLCGAFPNLSPRFHKLISVCEKYLSDAVLMSADVCNIVHCDMDPSIITDLADL